MGNDLFRPEIESGFEEPGGTTPPRIPRSTPRVLTIAFSVNLAVVTLYRARSQMVHFTFYYRKLGKYRLVFFREKDLEQKKKNVRLALVTYRLIGLTTYDSDVMYGMKIILGVRRISTVD